MNLRSIPSVSTAVWERRTEERRRSEREKWQRSKCKVYQSHCCSHFPVNNFQQSRRLKCVPQIYQLVTQESAQLFAAPFIEIAFWQTPTIIRSSRYCCLFFFVFVTVSALFGCQRTLFTSDKMERLPFLLRDMLWKQPKQEPLTHWTEYFRTHRRTDFDMKGFQITF